MRTDVYRVLRICIHKNPSKLNNEHKQRAELQSYFRLQAAQLADYEWKVFAGSLKTRSLMQHCLEMHMFLSHLFWKHILFVFKD